ncbi:MAG: hypothetical protein IMY67_08420 [Bacteroidetes bacterium]|nr:hypothetical protein [Bacteroidota bacterium]
MTDLYNNKVNIINTIKVLLFKKYQKVFNFIKYEDENIYLEPLLFSCFNSVQKNENLIAILEEILQGYFFKKEEIKVRYSFNKNDVAYIPQVGYFKRGNLNHMNLS